MTLLLTHKLPKMPLEYNIDYIDALILLCSTHSV